VTAPCPHGFAPGECLICRTLGTQPPVQVETSKRQKTNVLPAPTGAEYPPGVVRPDAVYAPHSRRNQMRPLSHYLLLTVGALIAIGAAIWLLSGIAFAILHVLELAIVAVGAVWAGYRVGRWRGRHERDRPEQDGHERR
jgi:hypothetical protein